MNILVVDDEKEIADIIAAYLENEGYDVIKCNDGKTAIDALGKSNIDLAILDVMLPDTNGFEILKTIRKSYTFPVLMLTAKNDYKDKVNGLTLGADDYIPKPFNPLELIARVKAQFRRYTLYNNPADDEMVMAEGLEVNKESEVCKYNGVKIGLTPTEFEILYLLCVNKGDTVSPEQIHEHIWGKETIQKNNSVMVHVRHLREKISQATGRDDIIKTVWGNGYKIDG